MGREFPVCTTLHHLTGTLRLVWIYFFDLRVDSPFAHAKGNSTQTKMVKGTAVSHRKKRSRNSLTRRHRFLPLCSLFWRSASAAGRKRLPLPRQSVPHRTIWFTWFANRRTRLCSFVLARAARGLRTRSVLGSCPWISMGRTESQFLRTNNISTFPKAMAASLSSPDLSI
jgi:hypothetical protein